MDRMRRGNYDSGQDYVLEYGELRFTFSEQDFSERVEQAARRLGFVDARLEATELEDLVNLAVNGEIQDPASALGEHVNDCWPELVGPADRSLVHWLHVAEGVRGVVEGDLELALLDALVEPCRAEDEPAQPVHQRPVGGPDELGPAVVHVLAERRRRVLDLAVDGEVDEVLELGRIEPPADEPELAGGLLDPLAEVGLVEGEAELAVLEDVVLS